MNSLNHFAEAKLADLEVKPLRRERVDTHRLTNAIAVRDSNSLWDFTAMTLTHLSNRDGVDFTVSATPESVKRKLEVLNG